MVFAFLTVFVAVAILVISLGVATLVMNRLLRRLDGNGDSFDTELEEVMPYESPIKLAIETIIRPRHVIEAGKISRYESEAYKNWLFGLAGMIGFIVPIIEQGISGIVSGLMGIFISVLGVWFGSWFFVRFRMLLFSYIGGVNLDYQEGKQVFSIVFLSYYILNMIIELISILFPNFLASHFNMGAYVLQVNSISLLGILAWIWIEVIYYFLLSKRYKLSNGESLSKLILMILVSIGITLVVGFMIMLVVLLVLK